jgi:hypothetical protein
MINRALRHRRFHLLKVVNDLPLLLDLDGSRLRLLSA